MAKKLQVEIDVDLNAANSIADLKELKKLLKTLPADSEEFKSVYNKIDDLEDKLKSAKNVSKDFFDTLEGAGGPIGQLGAVLNKAKVATQSFGSALKAAGIGLIVSAVGGLVAAFSQTDGAMKKLEPLFISLQKILGGIFEALTPLIDGFVELATQALPYVTKGVKIFYSSLVGLFTLVKEGGGGIAKILKGIFTLDQKAIDEGYKQLTGTWGKTVEAFEATEKRFEEGYAKRTKKEKELGKDAEEIRKKKLEGDLRELDQIEKLNEAELNKAKELALGLAQTEQEKLNVEIDFAAKRYELQKKALEDKLKLLDPKKDKEEYKNVQVALSELDATRTAELRGFTDQQKKIREDQKKAEEDFAKEIADIRVSAIKNETQRAVAAEEVRFQNQRSRLVQEMLNLGKTTEEMNAALELLEQTHQNNLTTILTNAELKRADIEKGDRDARYVRLATGASNDLDLQRTLLEAKKQADDDYYATQLAKEGLTTEQIRILNEQKLRDQIEYTNRSSDIERGRIAVKQQALSDIISIAGAESDVGRAALIAKQILAAKELILEVTRTITFSTQAAARSVVAVAEGTAQTAKVGFPQNIPLLIAYAAQAVAIISAIMSAVKSAKSSAASSGASGGGGGGASVQAPTPTFNGTVNVPAPQIGASAAQSSGTLGQVVTNAVQTNNSTSRPIQTYVVGSQVSTQQQLDRRISVAAKMGG